MATWVLLRGLARESGHWGGFPAMLAARLPGDRIVAIDLPGNGVQHRQRSPARIAGMADAARHQLGEMGLAPPWHLLALSLGAMVAVDWASRCPDEVAAAVLVNTSLRPFSPWWQRLRPANVPALLRVALGLGSAQAREGAILRMTSAEPGRHRATLDEWVRLRQAHPVSATNASRQLWAAMRYQAPTRPPPVPLLILNSLGDGLVDPRCSQGLARRWGASIAIHPRAGHDLPLDDGPWVADQVALWSLTKGEPRR